MAQLRTLLVDDDADQRRLVRALLERAGIGPVIEASDADSGLAAATEHAPELILLDIEMPGRTGLEVLPDLLDAAPGARVVVLSNFPRRRLGAVALARGAVGYVEKRVEPG
ncbi:MAG TPA: response regulator, partial [Acidimicrobiales bacterium]|nr:response regulator [Acidimicrobiales bacterium]